MDNFRDTHRRESGQPANIELARAKAHSTLQRKKKGVTVIFF